MAGRGEAGRGEAVVAFRNGERILVETTHLVNLASGFQLLLREPPPPAAIGQRVRLHGLAEAGGELIDLRLNGEPELAGVAFRNTILGPAEQVSLLALQLPTELSMQSRVARRKLFGTFDVNGNGFLSLAEVDRGVLQALRATSLSERKPVIARAFHAAKAACPSRSALGDDFVEEGAEFRLLLLYLRRYFELHLMFAALDTSGDRRLDRQEVLAAAPLLQRWGVAGAEADVFDAMDADGHGRVLFDEFAHWALAQHLQLEGVREGNLPSCRAPPPPPPPPRRTAVPRRPRREGEGEGKPACRQVVAHRHAALSPSPRRSMTPRETAARALREARMPAPHRRLRFTLEQALLELDVHLRKIHGHLPHDQTSPSRGLLGALKEHTAAAQRLDALLAAQLHALGEQPPLREVKDGLSLSKGEVRRWQRGLQAHTRAMEAASAKLTESRGALQQLCAILSGTASGTVWGGAHVEEKEKEKEERGEEEEEEEAEEEEEEEAEGGGGWKARDDVALCEQLAAHGFCAWPAVALAVGATAAACRERWDELLRGQLDAARTRQQEAREATHAAEQALAQTGGDIARVRQQMHAAMQASAASQRQQSSRSAPRWPVSGSELKELKGYPYLVMSTASEQELKHDNSVLLAEHTKRQSQYMRNAASSTHLRAETLDGVDLAEVRHALAWGQEQAREMAVEAFLGNKALRAIHEEARALTGDRGKPKKVLLSWLWAGSGECAAGVEWWIRSAALEHKVMLILLVSGSLRLKIAGYDCVHIQESQAILCPAKFWVRPLDDAQGHALTLIYGPTVCATPADWRSATWDKLDVPQPGVRSWMRRNAKKADKQMALAS